MFRAEERDGMLPVDMADECLNKGKVLDYLASGIRFGRASPWACCALALAVPWGTLSTALAQDRSTAGVPGRSASWQVPGELRLPGSRDAQAGWQLEPGVGMVSAGFLRGGTSGIAATAPHHAAGPRSVGIGRIRRWTLGVRALGVEDVPATIEDGRVVYRYSWLDTDDVVVADEASMQEWLVLRSADAPTRFAWAVDLPAGISGAREDLDGGVSFVDLRGFGVLRVSPAVAVDAQGDRHQVRLTWDPVARELRAELEHASLPHPVFVDPDWAQSATWTQVFPATSPAPRSAHSMAWHPIKKKVFLFGGYGCPTPGNCQYLSDTWSWDSQAQNWVQESVTGPPARAHAAMSENVELGGLFLFGGETATSSGLDDLWESADQDWTQITVTNPSLARSGHAFVTHMRQGKGTRMVLVGGAFEGNVGLAQWLFSMSPIGWTNELVPPIPGVRDASVVSTGVGQSVLLFGGLRCAAPPCQLNANTYRLDTTGKWAEVVPVGPGPGQRYAAASTFDSARQRAVVYGGRTSTGVCYSDTFDATTTRWYPVQPASGQWPGGRAYHAMAFDPVANDIVVFGGTKSLSNTMPSQLTDHLNDTWILKVTSGFCTDSSQCGTETCVDSACCQKAACGVCETCGSATDPGYCVPVKNAPDDSCSGTCDANGKCILGNGSACGPGDTCMSGICSAGICCDSQCADPCAQCTTGTCSPKAKGEEPTTACGDLLCSGGSTTCPSSCNEAPCKAPLLCGVDGLCHVEISDGTPCLADAGCTSGHCVEGVCCDQACDLPCDTCLSSKGAKAQGSCGPVQAGGQPEPQAACGGKTCPGHVPACACGPQAPCPTGMDCKEQTGLCEALPVDAGPDSASDDAGADAGLDGGTDSGEDSPAQDAGDGGQTPEDGGYDSGASDARPGCEYGFMKQGSECVPVPDPFSPASPMEGMCSVSSAGNGRVPGGLAWIAGGLLALVVRRRVRGKERA